MELISWSLLGIAFVSGVVFLLFLQVTIIYILFFRVTNVTATDSFSTIPKVDPSTFPQELYKLISDSNINSDGTFEGSILLNLLLQFWFREHRYDVNTLSAIANRINAELQELLSNTATLSHIFSGLEIHDIELGSESPTINNISITNIDVNKELNTLNNFVFEFDINYAGGFYMSIDASMKFNSHTAFVSIKVVKCIGRVRIEFTRIPYTYWCISFLRPPELQLVVETRVKGHSVPSLNKIIGNQLKKRINRKFVMPNYKIRSKPFLPTHNLINIHDNTNESIPGGILHINSISLSRIIKCDGNIFCMLTLDNDPWIKDVQSTATNSYFSQLFKRTNKEHASIEICKPSVSSNLFEKQEDGLRQRLKSVSISSENISEMNEMKRGKSINEAVDTLPKSNSETHSSRSNSEECIVGRTRQLPYSEIITFNEPFKFSTSPQKRFLNLTVWNCTSSDSIIGYVSLPITHIIKPGIGKKRRQFYLNAFNNSNNRINLHSTLSTHIGFNPSICFGDVVLDLKFTSSEASSISSTENTPYSLTPTSIITEFPGDIDDDKNATFHEFERIAISRQPKCEFCQKKIWLKEASKCIKCGYICHKKCVIKCEKIMECKMLDDEDVEPVVEAITLNPEIITTAPETNNGPIGTGKNRLSTFLANVKGMRKTGSASSLVPSSVEDVLKNEVHSLPHTPSYSPIPSRKTSLIIPDNVRLFENEAVEDEVEKALSYLMAQQQNEDFLDCVKNSGKKLCIDLSPDQRESRINEMISKIKAAIDHESNTFATLKEQTRGITEVEELSRLNSKVCESENRIQALTNLLLHCCSGLQDSHYMTNNTAIS